MAELTEIASGLRFPEGPIAMPDGSVILVEMFGKLITRVKPDGSKEIIADVPGGPNGIAFGLDCCLYICNKVDHSAKSIFLALRFQDQWLKPITSADVFNASTWKLVN